MKSSKSARHTNRIQFGLQPKVQEMPLTHVSSRDGKSHAKLFHRNEGTRKHGPIAVNDGHRKHELDVIDSKVRRKTKSILSSSSRLPRSGASDSDQG